MPSKTVLNPYLIFYVEPNYQSKPVEWPDKLVMVIDRGSPIGAMVWRGRLCVQGVRWLAHWVSSGS